MKIKLEDRALWAALTNYLDDFLLAAITQYWCDELMKMFLKLCQQIGVPVVMEKTESATTLIVFLGILLDGISHTLGIPQEKKDHAITELQGMLDRKKAMVKQLQALTELLNFLCRAIHPGRAFTRCMYVKFSKEGMLPPGLQ